MLHINKLKIMKIFFEEPSKNFQIREISRLSKIAVTSVKKYLNELLDESFIIKDKNTLYPSYVSNQQNTMFRVYKQFYVIIKIHESGLLESLTDIFHPRCIILFGSMAKGEYNKSSDIDLFVQSDEKKVNLIKFEKILKHNINIICEENINKLSQELSNNIINGIKIYGYLKLK